MNTAGKLIANELMPVYQTTDTGEKIVDGRELHNVLNVGRDFTTWMKERIQKYGFIEKEDFGITLTKTGERQNVLQHDYILKLDMAKELAMVENNEQGRKARKYFIEVEKRFQQNNVVNMPRVPLYTPYPEIEQADRLLIMLRNHKDLVNSTVNNAIQAQVVELITGKSLAEFRSTPGSEKQNLETTPKQNDRPQWTKDGYSAKTIGFMVGKTPTKVGQVAKKEGLQDFAYGGWWEYAKNREIFIYNEAGKEALLDILDEGRLGSP